MNFSSVKWSGLLVVSLGIGMLALCERAVGADAASAELGAKATAEGVIEPYTGPPIYLDEPPASIPPTLVERQAVTDKYPSGEKRFERQIARFSDNHLEADGFYREYYKSGQLFTEGQYRRGRQQGDWTYYYEDGAVNRKVHYEDGLPDGQVEVYHPDGTLMAKRNFAKGRRTGEWIVYDESGKRPLREEHYEDGKSSGVWKVWYPSGQLKRRIPFKNGEREGFAEEWNEDGSKRGEASYSNGVMDGTATIHMKDGRTVVRKYRQGKLLSEAIQ